MADTPRDTPIHFGRKTDRYWEIFTSSNPTKEQRDAAAVWPDSRDRVVAWKKEGQTILANTELSAEGRAKQLVASAYQGGRLAAVCTAVIEPIPFLRARFLVMRSMTDPAFLRSHAQIALALQVKDILEQW
jgi:hypothetical protein